MKLSKNQLIGIILWIFFTPLIAYWRYTENLPKSLGMIAKIKLFPGIFFKQMAFIGLILGIIMLFLFFTDSKKTKINALKKNNTIGENDNETNIDK